jgi:diaminohydroxyphosphoribosylaminopyrimidine deaminase/5-amino-6-(5-phosphoribosylamino)uracil reductase
MVGCVIVNDEKIIGEGYHHQYGGPHAEVNAINAVKDRQMLAASTLYVNLEPCSHHGKTPPCAQLIAKHKIPKIVIGNTDPHEKVAGNGIQMLENSGSEVIQNVLHAECRQVNRRFFCFHEQKRPYIILKWAQTMDGYIDRQRQPDEELKPHWITGDTARMVVHKWRSEEQAIMVGTKTALMDNPRLNVRDWHGRHPWRILIDRHRKVNDKYHLMDDTIKTYVFTEKPAVSRMQTHFRQIKFNDDLLKEIMQFLYLQDIQSVFIEGGAALLKSFIQSNLWDEARVFMGVTEFKSGVRAPVIDKAAFATQKIDNDFLLYYSNK